MPKIHLTRIATYAKIGALQHFLAPSVDRLVLEGLGLHKFDIALWLVLAYNIIYRLEETERL
jgi:hypothetical protein